MSLTQELRARHGRLWERTVTHPFVQELGADTLALERFQRYFLQDYVFLRDFCTLLALGVAKAPDLDGARRLAVFLAGVLQGEEQLFRRTFHEWGLKPEQYARPEPLPAATAFGNLMTRVAYEGSFAELLTVLVVTEWSYLDWATRLVQAGRRPSTRVYWDWIEIHSNAEFRDFVEWLVRLLDDTPLGEGQRSRVEELFQTTLRCELAFWEMGFHGEEWSG